MNKYFLISEIDGCSNLDFGSAEISHRLQMCKYRRGFWCSMARLETGVEQGCLWYSISICRRISVTSQLLSTDDLDTHRIHSMVARKICESLRDCQFSPDKFADRECGRDPKARDRNLDVIGFRLPKPSHW